MKFTGRTPRQSSQDEDESYPPARRRISTWILLADQHLVRLFRKHGPGLDAFGEITPPPRGRPLTNRTLGRASVAEVDKDLTKMPEPDLQDELRKIAWF
jgi:hypothetical protein